MVSPARGLATAAPPAPPWHPLDGSPATLRGPWCRWGEKGYIRIKRYGATGDEPCAEDKTPGDGTACKGSPKQLEVCGECGIMSDSSYPLGGHIVPGF